MNVIELTRRGSNEVVAHACGQCRVVTRSQEDAERCCAPRRCATCGETLEHSYCEPCWWKAQKKAEADRFEQATKVPAAAYDGPLLAEGVEGGDWGDGYFSDEAALRDACERHNRAVPAYAWACSSTRLTLDAKDILDDSLEQQEAREDAIDGIAGSAIEELQAFLTRWTDAHGVESWHPDYGRAVVFAPEGSASQS